MLLHLVENRDRVVSRNELLDLFWEGKEVYDDSLRKCLGTVRKALGDSSSEPRFIETLYGGGYRFIGPVLEVEPPSETLEISKPEFVSNPTVRGLTAPTSFFKRSSKRLLILVGLVLSLGAGVFLVTRARSATTVSNTAATSPSIAVMPLKNLTGDSADEYLSDGLTDSLINELARIENLKVISRASTFALKNKDLDPREIGRRLGVGHILEGSVARSGERIRINLRLVNTTDGRVVWSGDSFDRSFADIFTVQDEISAHVAENLRVILSGKQTHKRYTDNVPAYQAYLKGRYYWNKRTAEGITKSIEHYKEAVGLDPNYALAYAGLADSYVQGVWHVPFNSDEVVPKAKAAALKAVELDESLAEAHTALASVYSMEWEWDATGRELEQAIKLDPQYGRAYHVQAFHLMLMRRYDEAVASIKRALELDPLNLVVNGDAGEILFTAGREAEAFAQWKKTLELDPNFSMVHGHLYRAYVVKGDESAALAEYFKVMELNGEPAKKIAMYRSAASRNGLRGVWQKEMEEYEVARARGTFVPPINEAWFYTALGQHAKAIQNLESIYKSHSPDIVLITSPIFGSLRSDPAFQDLVRRVGLRV